MPKVRISGHSPGGSQDGKKKQQDDPKPKGDKDGQVSRDP